MSSLAPELEKKALRLPAKEREELAERLLSPLTRARLTAVEEAWVVEAECRYAAWKQDKRRGIPATRAIAGIRKALSR